MLQQVKQDDDMLVTQSVLAESGEKLFQLLGTDPTAPIYIWLPLLQIRAMPLRRVYSTATACLLLFRSGGVNSPKTLTIYLSAEILRWYTCC